MLLASISAAMLHDYKYKREKMDQSYRLKASTSLCSESHLISTSQVKPLRFVEGDRNLERQERQSSTAN